MTGSTKPHRFSKVSQTPRLSCCAILLERMLGGQSSKTGFFLCSLRRPTQAGRLCRSLASCPVQDCKWLNKLSFQGERGRQKQLNPDAVKSRAWILTARERHLPARAGTESFIGKYRRGQSLRPIQPISSSQHRYCRRRSRLSWLHLLIAVTRESECLCRETGLQPHEGWESSPVSDAAS